MRAARGFRRARDDHNPPDGRPRSGRLLRELALLAGLFLFYSVGRTVAGDDTAVARANARAFLDWERQLGLAWEADLNTALMEAPSVALSASWWYASLHYVVTLGVLIWLWQRRPLEYLQARSALVVATLVALIGYVAIPTAPPRLMPQGHWVDTLAVHADAGWWTTAASAPEGLVALTNQYAAMPSMHAGWALWCGLMLWRSTSRLVRHVGIGYAVVTGVVVVATGNHWIIDVLAGWGLVVLGLAGVRFAAAGGLLPQGPGCEPGLDRRGDVLS